MKCYDIVLCPTSYRSILLPDIVKASQREALQAAVELLKRDPRAIASPEFAFLKEL